MDPKIVLSDKQYQAVKLKNQGYKQKEVAQIMGIKVKTVKNLINIARKKTGNKLHNAGTIQLKEASFESENKDKVNKSDKQLLIEDIKNGGAAMARRALEDPEGMSKDEKLACGASGLGCQDYVFKKRAETLNMMAKSGRHKIVRIDGAVVNQNEKMELAINDLRKVSTKTKYMDDEDTAKMHFYCANSDAEVAAVFEAIHNPYFEMQGANNKILMHFEEEVGLTAISAYIKINGQEERVYREEFKQNGKTILITKKIFELDINKIRDTVNSWYNIDFNVNKLSAISVDFNAIETKFNYKVYSSVSQN